MIDYNALAAALRSEGLSDEEIAWVLYLDVEDVEGLA